MFTLTSLALTGVVVIIFGIVAGYGLAMLIGLPFTSLQQVSRRWQPVHSDSHVAQPAAANCAPMHA